MAELETESNVVSTKSRLRKAIMKHYSVRMHMTLIILASIASGMLLSKALLVFGLDSMTLRYLLAIVIGYLVFLLGVRIWLHCTGFDRGVVRSSGIVAGSGVVAGSSVVGHKSNSSSSGGGDFNFGSFDFSSGGNGGGASDLFAGKGGGFGGGGASDSFSDGPSIGSSGGSGGSGGGGFDIDGDALVILLLIALVLLVLIGTGGYVVYQAPSILSDSAFQMLLAGRLAKHAKRMSEEDWMGSLVRETWKSLLAILVVTMMFTLYAAHVYPAAHTMPEVINSALFGING